MRKKKNEKKKTLEMVKLRWSQKSEEGNFPMGRV